ncbi:hypothetical protein PVAP13_4NG270111 [Panicum virgatum]|uniref:Uncharacterized protein n=1 Tax=Panicum virgatum TaxID=38727 RepID=A0A8T0TIB5_PANVG|nr:hypothetical protein PVAP13_4NG270111 [Panicum virgatum]
MVVPGTSPRTELERAPRGHVAADMTCPAGRGSTRARACLPRGRNRFPGPGRGTVSPAGHRRSPPMIFFLPPSPSSEAFRCRDATGSEGRSRHAVPVRGRSLAPRRNNTKSGDGSDQHVPDLACRQRIPRPLPASNFDSGGAHATGHLEPQTPPALLRKRGNSFVSEPQKRQGTQAGGRKAKKLAARDSSMCLWRDARPPTPQRAARGHAQVSRGDHTRVDDGRVPRERRRRRRRLLGSLTSLCGRGARARGVERPRVRPRRPRERDGARSELHVEGGDRRRHARERPPGLRLRLLKYAPRRALC